MRLAAVLFALATLAACAPDAREGGWQPVRGPTVSVGGGVSGFVGTVR